MDIVQKLRSPDDGWSGNAVCVSSAVAEEGAAEIDRLRAALAKHGSHTSDCSWHSGRTCYCGWEELDHALQQSATEKSS
jgi:hypothetical protein